MRLCDLGAFVLRTSHFALCTLHFKGKDQSSNNNVPAEGIGRSFVCLPTPLATSQSGSQRVARIKSVVCQGKLYTFRLRRMARRILRAALSASISQGMGNSFTAVIG